MNNIVKEDNGILASTGPETDAVHFPQKIGSGPAALDMAGLVGEPGKAAEMPLYSDRQESSVEVDGLGSRKIEVDRAGLAPVAENGDHATQGGSTQVGTSQREQGPIKSLDPRPRIELPGPGRLISAVATELGQVLAPHGVYYHAKAATIFDEESKELVAVTPATFRTLIEDYVIPIKASDKGEVEQSLSSGDAGTVLASPQFLKNLRSVERLRTC